MVIFATAKGNVRKNTLEDFVNINNSGKIAMKLDQDDRIIGVKICSDDEVRNVVKNMMNEAHAISKSLGIEKPFDVERRIDAAKAVGEHKTSMLQDLERDRPMEIDALISSVQELGSITSIPTPTIDTVLALVKLRAKEAKLYK